MKINVANPATGAQKLFNIEDEKKYRIFYDKRISDEVAVDQLGDEFKGYIFRITGGADKEGFAMKQGVLTTGRVRLLLDGTNGHYRNRRKGDRRRKSVRGCIVSVENAVVNCTIVKKGEGEIAGLTDREVPHRLGPKRANHIRKFFNLSKEDDVRKYAIRRAILDKEGHRVRVKKPKIQRLVTSTRIRRKRRKLRLYKLRREKSKTERDNYEKLLHSIRNKESNNNSAPAQATQFQ
ncbi:40S ribosomal protein S6-like [Schistocerca gregaria]|uniref:40S ribosomal protein S6-like n=1 Tax=Schistocerca gregaria TaxID=7010 RepID=UPI00211EE640|nr:40S ribosomal protein S6-like [Schistocerca gregaria]